MRKVQFDDKSGKKNIHNKLGERNMNKLALNGGSPVTRNLLEHQNLVRHKDLERKYLLDAFESDVWDDWPGVESQASLFEKEWAEFNNSPFAALLTNGTHTLQVALESLGIGYGDEVLVPGITWQATASAVCDVNAVPVLVDVDPRTLTIDPEKAEAAITPRTRAMIPVHLYHRLADMDQLLEIAKKHGLYIIEDCAHTHGSLWDGKNAGTIGDFGSFSFQSSKLVNSGEGGALLMQTEENYLKVVSQRSCGREFKPGVKVHSGNYRMTAFQAGILRGKLAALKENVDRFDKQGLGWMRRLRRHRGFVYSSGIRKSPGRAATILPLCLNRSSGRVFPPRNSEKRWPLKWALIFSPPMPL